MLKQPEPDPESVKKRKHLELKPVKKTPGAKRFFQSYPDEKDPRKNYE